MNPNHSNIDYQLNKQFSIFKKIDQSIINNINKENPFHKSTSLTNDNSIHSKLYKKGMLAQEKKQQQIIESELDFNSKHFHPKISPYAKTIKHKENDVYKRLSITTNDSSTRDTTHSKRKKNHHHIHLNESNSNDNEGESNINIININNDQYLKTKKCYCNKKHKVYFPFKPEISKQSGQIASKLKTSSQERILTKKQSHANNINFYLSKHPHSLYYVDTYMLSQEESNNTNISKGNSISKCIELYNKGQQMLKNKQTKIKEFKLNEQSKEEQFTFKPTINKHNPFQQTHLMYSYSNLIQNNNNNGNGHDNNNTNCISNSSSIKMFLNNNKHFQNRRQRNIMRLQKANISKEKQIQTFSPEINRRRPQDDYVNISRQIAYINDYVKDRRKRIAESLEKEESEVNKSLSKLSVSKRKFISHSTHHEIISQKSFGYNRDKSNRSVKKNGSFENVNNKSKEVLYMRDQYGLNEFYNKKINYLNDSSDDDAKDKNNNTNNNKYMHNLKYKKKVNTLGKFDINKIDLDNNSINDVSVEDFKNAVYNIKGIPQTK